MEKVKLENSKLINEKNEKEVHEAQINNLVNQIKELKLFGDEKNKILENVQNNFNKNYTKLKNDTNTIIIKKELEHLFETKNLEKEVYKIKKLNNQNSVKNKIDIYVQTDGIETFGITNNITSNKNVSEPNLNVISENSEESKPFKCMYCHHTYGSTNNKRKHQNKRHNKE